MIPYYRERETDGCVTIEPTTVWEEARLHRWQLKTTIGDVFVSTVFLGIDHSFGGPDPRPILYETMVFGGPMDQDQERYCTREEAIDGHQRTVQRVRDEENNR